VPKHLQSPADPQPVAYSYVRFSSPKQAEGDSLRRQTEAAAAWCKDHKVRLDTSATLHDLGKSAFTGKHRENPDRNALAAFLKLVERDRIPRGSHLIVEALDRLTREDIQPALLLIIGLLQAGIRIVQLIPVPQVYTDKSGPHEVMLMVVELMRGHSESKAKSERCGAAWAMKKEAAREKRQQPPRKKDGRISQAMTANCPRWIEERGGKLRPIPDRVKLVKKVFELAASGYGMVSLAKKLKADGIPSFGGRRKEWTRSYLALILKDRRALGEHQPMKNGKKDGPVIPDYYPAVVTENEWLAARAGRQERVKKRGRVGKRVNIFAGLLRSAVDGGPYHLSSWKVGGRTSLALVNFRATEGLTGFRSYPYDTLEAAILSQLRELDPREVLDDGKGNDGPDELAVLAGQLAEVDTELAEVAAFMEREGFSPTLGKRVQTLEEMRRTLSERIADAKSRSAHPVAESWGEFNTLSGLLANAPDPTDLRLRLQAALRRIVTGAWMVVVARGSIRLARINLYFGEGPDAPFRSYLVVHQPAVAPRGKLIHPATWAVRSIKHAGPIDKTQWQIQADDLRDLTEAECVVRSLESYPQECIDKLLSDG
jgi:DNA invertase Pin-like site-specific DNA recombinase